MRLKWLQLASLTQKNCTLYTIISLVHYLFPKDNHFLRTNLFWIVLFSVFACLVLAIWCGEFQSACEGRNS